MLAKNYRLFSHGDVSYRFNGKNDNVVLVYERGSDKGSFGHFSCFYVIKISKTPKISIFCMFLQASQIASDKLYNQRRKHF